MVSRLLSGHASALRGWERGCSGATAFPPPMLSMRRLALRLPAGPLLFPPLCQRTCAHACTILAHLPLLGPRMHTRLPPHDPVQVRELELNMDLQSVNNLLEFLEKVFNGGSGELMLLSDCGSRHAVCRSRSAGRPGRQQRRPGKFDFLAAALSCFV